MFATGGRVPSWSSGDRPRVLVEQRGVAYDAVAGLEAAGFDVIACAGRVTGRPECPLLRGERCPLAVGADAILVAMAPGPERDALVAAHRRDGTPVTVIEPSRSAPLSAEALIEAARSTVGSDPDVGADLEHLVGRQSEEP